MSEVLSRKRLLSSNEFEKLLVCMIYTSGDMSYYERDYESKSIHCTDLEECGSMTCNEANNRIGLFHEAGIHKEWKKLRDATAFYRLQQDYKCFVLVLHDGNE